MICSVSTFILICRKPGASVPLSSDTFGNPDFQSVLGRALELPGGAPGAGPARGSLPPSPPLTVVLWTSTSVVYIRWKASVAKKCFNECLDGPAHLRLLPQGPLSLLQCQFHFGHIPDGASKHSSGSWWIEVLEESHSLWGTEKIPWCGFCLDPCKQIPSANRVTCGKSKFISGSL